MEKYDEDLNTTLIFVRFVSTRDVHALTKSQAGLFSAVTSAFIIQLQSQFQSDPNDETAALLRVLLYKIDNTTFGNDVPTLPQWTGPPRTIVQVQAILLASLAASLLSAFLAMLGKQWLNRYASTDMRGSAIERSQNRQRKLDGVVTWYFDYVMEALPLMLQVALLLLGCALSRYLWEINIILASVVFSVTSFGMAFYIFIIVAGTASVICPYQTPGARFLRYVFHQILPLIFRNILLPALRSALSAISKLPAFISSRFSDFIEASFCRRLTVKWWSWSQRPWYSAFNITISLFYTLVVLPIALAIDTCILGGGTVFLLLLAFFIAVYGPILLGIFACDKTLRRWFAGLSSPRVHSLGQQAIALDRQAVALDLRCISWMLQTSLDKVVLLSALKHLATMMTLGNFDPTLVSGCFDVFVDCIKVDVNTRKVVAMQGLEQLATVSAMCFLRTFHHLSTTNPTLPALKDVRQRYSRVFPHMTDFDFSGLPFYSTMAMIHSLAHQCWYLGSFQWGERRPSSQECISFTRGMAEIAQVKYQEYQEMQHRKVPRWILRFALHFMPLEPLPPASVVADYLSIIAMDLGCDVSNTGFMTSDERSVRISQMTLALTLKQCASGAGCGPDCSEPQNGG
jgi:hypothetical protein